MTAPRWFTRVVGLGLIAVLAAVLGIVAALPSGAAQRDPAAGAGVSARTTVPSVDGHVATRLPALLVVKRFTGTEHAVVPAAMATSGGPSTTSPGASNRDSMQADEPGTVAARAPPTEGTSRS